jgi:4-hydroxymandelate oxidase
MTVDLLATRRDSDPRLAAVVGLSELAAIARERMHPAAFDYVAGGAWDEISLTDNEAAWRRRRFRPRVLRDVSSVATATTILGHPASLPLAIAPMAAHGLAHPDGEVATARAAAAAGVPFCLSTMSSRSIEEVAAAAAEAERTGSSAPRWFQLYLQADRGLDRELVERAEAAGYGAIVLTVDLPVLGYRERDLRSGFRLDVPLGNFGPAGPPADGWPTGAVPATASGGSDDGYEMLGQQRHLGLVWDDLAEVRSWSRLPFAVKGILTGEDAARAAELGVDAVIVSNHGARQLDRVPAGLDVLAEVVAAVDGRCEVLVDGGVRRGLDIAIGLALGARAVLVGRPMMWALAAGGEAGVARALAIVRDELERALALLGASSVDGLDPSFLVAWGGPVGDPAGGGPSAGGGPAAGVEPIR